MDVIKRHFIAQRINNCTLVIYYEKNDPSLTSQLYLHTGVRDAPSPLGVPSTTSSTHKRAPAYLRKLENAATVAFIEIPISAMARLNTRKLLGVRNSLILRKATTVTAFRKNPRRPSEDTENV